MEIDFSETKLADRTTGIVVGGGLILILFFSWVGCLVTPIRHEKPGLLTWAEWQVLKGARAYQAELTQLQQEIDQLAEMLTQTPDPVRAQLTAARLVQAYGTGEPALQAPREGLIQAALAVQAWAIGADTWETAQAAVNTTSQTLATLSVPAPEPSPPPQTPTP